MSITISRVGVAMVGLSAFMQGCDAECTLAKQIDQATSMLCSNGGLCDLVDQILNSDQLAAEQKVSLFGKVLAKTKQLNPQESERTKIPDTAIPVIDKIGEALAILSEKKEVAKGDAQVKALFIDLAKTIDNIYWRVDNDNGAALARGRNTAMNLAGYANRARVEDPSQQQIVDVARVLTCRLTNPYVANTAQASSVNDFKALAERMSKAGDFAEALKINALISTTGRLIPAATTKYCNEHQTTTSMYMFEVK